MSITETLSNLTTTPNRLPRINLLSQVFFRRLACCVDWSHCCQLELPPCRSCQSVRTLSPAMINEIELIDHLGGGTFPGRGPSKAAIYLSSVDRTMDTDLVPIELLAWLPGRLWLNHFLISSDKCDCPVFGHFNPNHPQTQLPARNTVEFTHIRLSPSPRGWIHWITQI